MNWKIAIYWIIASVIVGMGLGFVVHPDIGSFVLIAIMLFGSFAAIVHYLIVYVKNNHRNLKQLTPVALILAFYTVFAFYIYRSIVTCDIDEQLSYSAAAQFVKKEGFDVALLEKSGKEILGCNYIFAFDVGNINRLLIVDRDGVARFNN